MTPSHDPLNLPNQLGRRNLVDCIVRCVVNHQKRLKRSSTFWWYQIECWRKWKKIWFNIAGEEWGVRTTGWSRVVGWMGGRGFILWKREENVEDYAEWYFYLILLEDNSLPSPLEGRPYMPGDRAGGEECPPSSFDGSIEGSVTHSMTQDSDSGLMMKHADVIRVWSHEHGTPELPMKVPELPGKFHPCFGNSEVSEPYRWQMTEKCQVQNKLRATIFYSIL